MNHGTVYFYLSPSACKASTSVWVVFKWLWWDLTDSYVCIYYAPKIAYYAICHFFNFVPVMPTINIIMLLIVHNFSTRSLVYEYPATPTYSVSSDLHMPVK